MSVTLHNAPVAEATARVLELFCPGQVARRFPQPDQPYLVCSYREDFAMLWRLYDDAEQGVLQWITQAAAPTIVIVWDGIPVAREPTINVADYVTPYDWAIACSLVVFNRWQSNVSGGAQTQLADLPHLRLLILDLSPQQHRRSAFGPRQFNVLAPSLPWIRDDQTNVEEPFSEARRPASGRQFAGADVGGLGAWSGRTIRPSGFTTAHP